MTCREFVEFLLDYHEENLEPEARARFDAHLEICPDCQSYLGTYGRAVDLARLTERAREGDPVPAEVPEDLIEAILRSRPR